MKTIKTLLAATALGAALALGSAGASAAGKAAVAEDVDFSFEGMFGTFDRAQLQRGFLVYKQVCASCHGMEQLYYRNLMEPGGPEFTEEQVKAIAAEYEVTDGPNEDGDMFERPATPADKFKSPFANEQAARSVNGGAYPTDLSLITKKREGFHYPWYVSPFIKLVKGNGGPEYVRAVLLGYQDPPAELADQAGDKAYNPYFAAGPWISMARRCTKMQSSTPTAPRPRSNRWQPTCRHSLPGQASRRWNSASPWASWSCCTWRFCQCCCT
jgi:ubiquinol-cytochrome c reductase cytochrome c1 subunit